MDDSCVSQDGKPDEPDMLSVVENTIGDDKDRQLEKGIFPPKTVCKLLNLSSQNYRRIRKEIDPFGDTRKHGFTHNALFVYFIFFTLRERWFYSVSDIAKFKWPYIFEACEKIGLNEIKEMGIVFCPASRQLWLTPKGEYLKAMKDDRFKGLKMDYVYQDYVSHLALNFETLLDRQLKNMEKAKLLLSQPNFKEVLLGKPGKSASDQKEESFDDFFSGVVEKLE